MYGITTLLDKNINTFAHTHLIIKIPNQMHYTSWVYPCCALWILRFCNGNHFPKLIKDIIVGKIAVPVFSWLEKSVSSAFSITGFKEPILSRNHMRDHEGHTIAFCVRLHICIFVVPGEPALIICIKNGFIVKPDHNSLSLCGNL